MVHHGTGSCTRSIIELVPSFVSFSPPEVATTLAMAAVVNEDTGLLKFLGIPDDAATRAGAADAMLQIVQALNTDVLPYAAFFVLPLMARMRDQHEAVRTTSTLCFALIVKILPLESAIPTPKGFSEEMIAKTEEQRKCALPRSLHNYNWCHIDPHRSRVLL